MRVWQRSETPVTLRTIDLEIGIPSSCAKALAAIIAARWGVFACPSARESSGGGV